MDRPLDITLVTLEYEALPVPQWAQRDSRLLADAASAGPGL